MPKNANVICEGSPNIILEIGLKSFIIFKLDNQVSKCWKQMVAYVFETTTNFGQLKIGVSDFSV